MRLDEEQMKSKQPENHRKIIRRSVVALLLLVAAALLPALAWAELVWLGYGGKPQHDGLSTVTSLPLQRIG